MKIETKKEDAEEGCWSVSILDGKIENNNENKVGFERRKKMQRHLLECKSKGVKVECDFDVRRTDLKMKRI